MDLIEGIQKLAPWAGSLPIFHKAALTVAICGVTSLCLLVIWMPSPVKKGAAEKLTTPLNIFVNSSGAAAEAAAKFSELLNDSSAQDKVKSDVEKEKLKHVIRRLVSIEYNQAPLPWLLRGYVQEDAPGNWEQVKHVIAMNSPIISELVEILESFDGDLIYKDMETYKQLRFMMNSRAGLYSQLSTMEPPKSEAEKQQLLEIARNFDKLISQMKIIQSKLGEYLENG